MLSIVIALFPIFKILLAYAIREYGDDIVDYGFKLVVARDKERKNKRISGNEARELNIELLQKATKSSPGLSYTDCLLINQANWMKFVYENQKWKWDAWRDRIKIWKQKSKRYTKKDFDRMGLYTSGKDKS